jgi:hypothetical protein
MPLITLSIASMQLGKLIHAVDYTLVCMQLGKLIHAVDYTLLHLCSWAN